MNRLILVFLGASLTLLSLFACADTIELKSGRKIVGEIMQETEDAVVVSKDGGCFIYSIARERIQNIRESTPEEIEKQKQVCVTPSSEAEDEDERTRREKIKEYRLEQYQQEVEAAKMARGRIKIKFSQDRFGVVDVLLNGKVTAAMLVDTGASMVVVSNETARKLGITDTSDKPDIPVVLADGSITTATPITLKSVEVGNSKVKDVEAAISKKPPGGGIDGLLGMTFLRYFHVKLDSKENCLILEKY